MFHLEVVVGAILVCVWTLLSSGADGWLGINFSDVFTMDPLEPHIAFEILKAGGWDRLKFFEVDEDRMDAVVDVYGCHVNMYISSPNKVLEEWSANYSAAYEQMKRLEDYGDLVWLIGVGNEPLLEKHKPETEPFLADAYFNALRAKLELGLYGKATVTFSGEVTRSFNWDSPETFTKTIKPIFDSLLEHDSYLSSNLYPYFVQKNDREIFSMEFAAHGKGNVWKDASKWCPSGLNCVSPWKEFCGYKKKCNTPWRDFNHTAGTHLDYYWLFDFLFDRNFDHLASNNYTTLAKTVIIGECGWPTYGDTYPYATLETAGGFLQKMVDRATGVLGTPAHPDLEMNVYLFEAFDSDDKFRQYGGGLFENNFGYYTRTGGEKFPGLVKNMKPVEVNRVNPDEVTYRVCAAPCVIDPPKNGWVSTTRAQWEEFVEFGCKSGYEIQGSSTAQCWAFGSLKPKGIPNCTAIEEESSSVSAANWTGTGGEGGEMGSAGHLRSDLSWTVSMWVAATLLLVSLNDLLH